MRTIIILSFYFVAIYSILVTAFILIAPSDEAIKDFFTFETPSNLDWRFV